MPNEETQLYKLFTDKLQLEEQRSTALKDIKNLISLKPPDVASETIRGVGIAKLVECLNVNNKEQVDLTCDVLKICFEKFPVGDIVKKYTGHIMYLLRHEKDCVRRLAIDEVYKTVTAEDNSLPVPEYIDIFVAVAQLISDNDVGIANKAILVTSNLPNAVYPKVLEEMKIVLQYSKSSKCNAYEVIINLSAKSPDLFKLSSEYGYIDEMVKELQTEDLLYHLNILELLSRLAINPCAINYLVEHGAMSQISEQILGLKQNPLGNLLIPGYLKFFGSIAHIYPRQIIEKYPTLVNLLYEVIESGEQSTLPVALDTLGFVGTTVEGKLSLASTGGSFIKSVEKLGQIFKNSPTDIKICSLNSLASLISIDRDPATPKTGPVDHRVTLMTREWFRSLSQTPPSMEILFDMCKNPFPDIKMAAFGLLEAVVQHQWGEELVARLAGSAEYLLDRSMDNNKEIKELKYDIIKRLSNSQAFDTNIASKFQLYVEQGPFYSETLLQVAMEEGD